MATQSALLRAPSNFFKLLNHSTQLSPLSDHWTKRSVLLKSATTQQNLPKYHSFPPKNKEANVCPDEDAYDQIAIVIHRKPRHIHVSTSSLFIIYAEQNSQHNKIRNSKSAHMDQCPDSLLEDIRSKDDRCVADTTSSGRSTVLTMIGGG